MSQADFLKSKKEDIERHIIQLDRRRNDKQREIDRNENEISEIDRQLSSKRVIQEKYRAELKEFDDDLKRLRADLQLTTDDLLAEERKDD